MKPFIPVLMSEISKLTDPLDIIKYVLRSYTHLPKNINDTFHDQEISFRWDDADVGHNKEMIKGRVSSSLTEALTRYFPNASIIDVTTNTEDIDDVRYSVIIDIVVIINDRSYVLSDNFVVNNDGTLAYIMQGG